MKKKGNILAENIIFIILNLAFIGIIVLFISMKTGDAAVLEEVYAKQIALMIDAAKPNMIISLNIDEGIKKLAEEKNKKIDELTSEEIENTVKIQGNTIIVKIREGEGKSYSYSFFNNINVTPPKFNKEKNELYFTTKAFEKPAGSDILKIISYAKDNVVVDRQCNCGEECGNYANLITKYANENGIDSVLFLSLMMQESQCDKTVSSDSSVGLMQINPTYYCGKYGLDTDPTVCKTQLLTNVELNINVGTQVLKWNYDTYKVGKLFVGCNKQITYYELDAALRGYNGWGCNSNYPAQDSFVEEINERYNLLKEVK